MSSKNGHNFDYVIHRIKKIKEEAKEKRSLKPKFFILGNANVGKSSFINKLIQTSNKFLNEERKKKKQYKTNYSISDPRLVDLNKEADEVAGKTAQAGQDAQGQENSDLENLTSRENSEQEDFDEVNLTTSPLPGTTIGITKVNSMTIGAKVNAQRYKYIRSFFIFFFT